MPASTEQKVDFLLKKIGYTASKSGIAEDSSLSGTKKAPFAEAIPSPIAIPSTNIWSDSTHIPATPPGSDTAYVKGYRAAASGLRMTVDSSVSGSRAFIAYTTYNNTSTAILGDWIDTQFGSDYIVKVYKGDPNSGGTQLSAAGAGSNDTWFFDYASGVLNFNGTQIPSGVSDTNIYIVAYRYIGAKGALPPAGIGTFKQLYVTGISTFDGNIDANADVDIAGNVLVGGALTVTGTTTFNGGTITFGDAASDNVVFGADIDSHVIPDDDDTYDLGSSTQQWRNLYVDGTGDIDTLNVIDATFTGGTTVASASTYNGLVDVNNRLDVVGGANVDQLNVVGIATFNTVTLPPGGGGGNFGNINIGVTGDNEIDTDTGDLLIDSAGGTVRVDDRLEVIGVSTFSSLVDVNNRLDVVGGANVDQLNVSGVSTTAGLVDINAGAQANTLKVEDLTSGRVVLAGTGGEIEDSGNLTFNGTKLTVTGNAQITTDLDVDGGANIVGGLTADQVNVTGVSTYAGTAKFDGLVDVNNRLDVVGGANVDQLNVTGISTYAGNIDINGNVEIAGTLDVDGDTQLDDLNVAGVATFSAAVDINSTLDVDGDTQLDDLNVTGVSTFTALVDVNNRLDVVGGANVDQVNVAGVSTYGGNVDINANVDVSGTSTLNDDVTFTGAASNAVWDKSDNRLEFADNASIGIGNDDDLELSHDGTTSLIRDKRGSGSSLKIGADSLTLQNKDGNEAYLVATDNGSVDIYYDFSKKFSTTGIGVSVHNGIGNTATIAGPSNLIIDPGVVGDDTGAVRIKGDLYVDGTNFTVASGTIELADHVVGIATTSGTNAILDGGGIGIGSDNIRKTFVWNNASAALKSSEHLDIATGKVYKINGDNVLSSDTLGTNILYSSLQTVGVLRGLNVSGVSTFGGNIDANADLDVDGNTTLDNLVVAEAANIVGGLTADQLNVTGVSTYGGVVDINDNVTISGTLDVDGDTQLDDLNVAGVATFSAAIDANGTLDVDGDTQLDDLNVSGVSTFSALVDVNNRLDVVGGSNLDQLNVTGVSTFTGNIDANGNLDVDGQTDLDVLNVAEIATFSALIDANARLDVVGGVNADQVNVSGVSTFGGNIDANGNLDVDGQTDLDVLNVSETATFSALVDVNNRLDVVGGANIDQANVSGISTLAQLKMGTVAVTHIRDEDNMSSDSDTSLATQQSIKAYVDSQVTAQDLDVTSDNGTIAIDLDSETLDIAGTANEIETSASGNEVTIGLPNAVTIIDTTISKGLLVSGISTLTDLRIGNANSIDIIRDEDNMASNDVNALATQQSIKAYVDSNITAQDLDFTGDTGSGSIDLDSETFQLTGTPFEIVTTGSGQVLNVSLPDDVIIGAGLTVTSKLTVGGSATVGITTILDEDNMASDSATALATQQSIKKYVDDRSPAGPGGGNLAVSADSGSNQSINLNTEVLDIEGTSNEIETVTGTNKVIIGLPNAVTILDATISGGLNVTGVSTFTGNMSLLSNTSTFKLGAGSGALSISGDTANGHGYIQHSGAGDFFIRSDTGFNFTRYSGGPHEKYAIFNRDSSVDLYFDNVERFNTSIDGVHITGVTSTTSLNVIGVSTFTGTIDANGLIDADGGANIVGGLTVDQVNATGISTLAQLKMGSITATSILDEDNMASDSAAALATQQSIKAYVDSQVTAQDLDFQADTGGALSIDLDSEVLGIVGTSNEIETVGSGNNVTIGLPNAVTIIDATISGGLGVTGVSTFTGTIDANGLIDADGGANIVGGATIDQANVTGVSTFTGTIDANGALDVDGQTDLDVLNVAETATFSALVDVNNRLDVVGGANIDQLNVSGISTLAQLKMGSITATSILDEDNMASDSAAALATQQSIKAYVDAQVTASDLDFQADTGGALAIDLDSEVLTIAGTSNEIETVGSGNQVTIGLPNAVTILDATISGGLNVSGVTTTTNLQVGAAGTTITTQNATSRVGINSTAPAYMLDVGGIINSSTDVRINGVSVVDQALNDAVAMAIALG